MSAIRVGKSFFGWTVSISGDAKELADPDDYKIKAEAVQAARDLQEYAGDLGFGFVPVQIRED